MMLTYQRVRDAPLSFLEFFSHQLCFQRCQSGVASREEVGKRIGEPLEVAENAGNLRKRQRGNSSMIRRSSRVSRFTRINLSLSLIYPARLVSRTLSHFCRLSFLPCSSCAACSTSPSPPHPSRRFF